MFMFSLKNLARKGLIDPGLALYPLCLPGATRENVGFVIHICISGENRAVFHDAYMQH